MADDTGPIGPRDPVCITCGNEKFYDRAGTRTAVEVRQMLAVRCFRTFCHPRPKPRRRPLDRGASMNRRESISYGDSSPDTNAWRDVRDLDARLSRSSGALREVKSGGE